MTHLWREFFRPDPHGPGRARCWCGWSSKPCWLEIRARAEHETHAYLQAVADSGNAEWENYPERELR